MSLHWIDVREFPFACLSLFERFQIRLILDAKPDSALCDLGLALRHQPDVRIAMALRCPERASRLEALAAAAPADVDDASVREAEIRVMDAVEDFVIYTHPELMDTHCDFIYGWEKARLFELADFSDTVVLDVGSGSGRLAFAAAERARRVYASEPVAMLREYLRDRAAREGIRNIDITDGMADHLAYPDDFFDIVMSGHVVGDDYDAEIAELWRVTRPGGWILDCPGDGASDMRPSVELRSRGWEEFHYRGTLGGEIYQYRIRVEKPAGAAAEGEARP